MPPNPMAYGAQVADLLRDRGSIEAQRALQRGATLASAWQAVPQAAAGFVQARDARRAAAQAEADRQADRQWQDQVRQRTMADWGKADTLHELALTNARDEVAERKAALSKRLFQERAEAVSKALGHATNQAEWDAGITTLKEQDINGLPPVFSPAARQRALTAPMTAAQMLAFMQPAEPEPLTTIDVDGVETRVPVSQAVNKPVWKAPKEPEKVTFPREPQPMMVDGKRGLITWGSDGKPYLPGTTTPFTGRVQPLAEKPTETGLTQAQKQAAETRKQTRLLQVEQRFLAGQAGEALGEDEAFSDDPIFAALMARGRAAPMTVAQREAVKLLIENAYRQEVGLPRLSKLGPEWGTSRPTPPAAPARTGGPGPSGRGRGAPPLGAGRVEAAPAPGALPAVPSAPPRDMAQLPGATAVGDTLVQDGTRLRVSKIDGQRVALEPAPAPKKGDIIIVNGERWKITDITADGVKVDPVD